MESLTIKMAILFCVFLVLKSTCQPNMCPNELYPTPVTLLGSAAVSQGAVCLDGSPPVYYHGEGFGNGMSKWIIFLEGGGWCENVTACQDRALHGDLGGSGKKDKIKTFQGMFSRTQSINPDFFEWNKVFVGYCDGSSYMGDIEAVDPTANLYYRGRRVFKGVVGELLNKGMVNATNAILMGTSAGGLGTILHCDGFRAMLPSACRVKCISDAGYFIHAKDLPGVKKREDRFAGVVSLHGLDKFLPESCTSKRDPGLCLFPEYLVNDVQTPLFLLNSRFDQFQITFNLDPFPGDELGWENCTKDLTPCSISQLETIKLFGIDFIKSMPKLGNVLSRGMYITSCYTHGQNAIFHRSCDRNPTLANKTILEAIGDWYFDRSPFQVVDIIHSFPWNCSSSTKLELKV